MPQIKRYLFIILLICLPVCVITQVIMPEEIMFAGHRIPLERPDVNERISELFNIYTLDRKGHIQNLLTRKIRYYNKTVRILEDFGLHPDLAYIIAAESGFDKKAVSPEGAAGLWQLMPATARMYGLRVDKYVDERFLPLYSTRAAAEHLRMLSDVFNDDPFLILSAYNNGDSNVRKMLESQGTDDVWGSVSNIETEKYLEKVLVYKIILSDPEKYGFEPVGNQDTEKIEKTNISLGPKDLPFPEICRWSGITFRDLYKLNPHIRFGTYKEPGSIEKYTSLDIYLPEGSPDLLLYELRNNGYLSEFTKNSENTSPPVLEDVYTVSGNENLESICFKYGVDWKKTAELNDLKIITLPSGIETAEIHNGQKLRIVK